MAEAFFVPDTMPSMGNRGAQSNHKRDSSRIDLGAEPKMFDKARRRNSATQSARAKVKWKNLKMKMRVAKKFEKAYKEGKKMQKAKREEDHSTIVKLFRTRLVAEDTLMQKTIHMGFGGTYYSQVNVFFNPSGWLRMVLDILSFILIIFSWFLTMYNFCFLPDLLYPEVEYMVHFADLFYVFDCVQIVAMLKKFDMTDRKKYSAADTEKLERFRKFLVVDIIAALPLYTLLGGNTCGRDNRYFCTIPHAFKTFKIFSVLRFMLGYVLETRKRESRMKLFVQRLGRVTFLLLSMFFVIHMFTCIWFFICMIEPEETNWFKQDHYNKPETGQIPFEDVPTFFLYTKSFYYSWLMLIGEGIDPLSPTQYLYASLLIVLGTIVVAVIIGEVAVLIQKFTHAHTLYEHKVENVTECMNNLKLPQNLQNRIQDYYRFMWNEHRTTTSQPVPFLDDLSPSLKEEVDLYLKRSLVNKSELFKSAPKSYVRALVPMLKHTIYLRGDFIMREGEFGEEMYFITNGSCLVSLKGKRIAIMERGSNFGEIALITKTERTASVHALTNVTLYSLHKSSVAELESHFPHVLKDSIGQYLEKHNLVFAKSPTRMGSDNEKKRKDSGIHLVSEEETFARRRASVLEDDNKKNTDSPADGKGGTNSNMQAVYSPTNGNGSPGFRVGKVNSEVFGKTSPVNSIQDSQHSYAEIQRSNSAFSNTSRDLPESYEENMKKFIASEIKSSMVAFMKEFMNQQKGATPPLSRESPKDLDQSSDDSDSSNEASEEESGAPSEDSRRGAEKMPKNALKTPPMLRIDTQQQSSNNQREPSVDGTPEEKGDETVIPEAKLDDHNRIAENKWDSKAWRKQKLLQKRLQLMAGNQHTPVVTNSSKGGKKPPSSYIVAAKK